MWSEKRVYDNNLQDENKPVKINYLFSKIATFVRLMNVNTMGLLIYRYRKQEMTKLVGQISQ